jgi:hypothetical protein
MPYVMTVVVDSTHRSDHKQKDKNIPGKNDAIEMFADDLSAVIWISNVVKLFFGFVEKFILFFFEAHVVLRLVSLCILFGAPFGSLRRTLVYGV